MFCRRIIVSSLIMAALGIPALAQAADPADVVRRLYSTYKIGEAPDARGFRMKEAKELFSKGLFALYGRAAKAGLDSDFFVQGQDFSLVKPIDITTVDISGDRAVLSASLTQNGFDAKTNKPQMRIDRFTYALVKEGGAWRIDDATHEKKSVRREWQEVIQSARGAR